MRCRLILPLLWSLLALPLAAQISFTVSASPVYSNIPVTFTDTSTMPAVASLWNINGQYVGGGCGCRIWTVNHTFASPGVATVTLILINSNGGSQSYSQSVTVVPGPTAVVTPSSAAGCRPFATMFNGSASSTPFGPIVSYAWQFSDGASATGVNAPHTFTTSGNHWADLTITDSLGYSHTKRANVTVYGSSASLAVMGSALLCGGSSGTIALTLAGDPPYSMLWSDGLVQTAAQDGVVTRTVTPTAVGSYNYTVLVTDGSNCQPVVSGSATFIIPAQPVATLTLLTNPACAGAPFTIQAAVSGGFPPYSVTWSDGVTQSASPFLPTPTRTFTRPAGPFTIGIVSASNSNCTTSQTAQITVNVANLPSAQVSGETHLSYGEVGRLTANLIGNPPFTLTWSDGVVQSVNTNQASRLVIPAATTIYTLTNVQDASGCSGLVNPASVTMSVDQSVPLDGHALTIDSTSTLRRVRLSDGVTLSTLPINLTGFVYTGIRAIARRPGTNDYFVLFTAPGMSALATLDETTGNCTTIAFYNEILRGLTFDDLGRLLAHTQSNIPFPGTIYELNPLTGLRTTIGTHPFTSGNVRIAFNRNAHVLTFFGGGSLPETKAFVSYELAGLTQTWNGFTYRPGELSGNVLGFTPINGYNFLATIGGDLYLAFGTSGGIIKVDSLDHTPSVIVGEADAFAHLAGSGEDLLFETSKNGQYGVEGRKYLAAGDTLGLTYLSPAGGLGGSAALLVLDLFGTGQDPYFLSPIGISPIHVGASSALVVGTTVLVGGSPIIGSYPVPPGLSGLSSRLQVIVASPAARNGIFAASEAFEFVFLP